MTCRDMILHDIAQNDIELHYIALEEKEMWVGNMNACEDFHHFLHALSYRKDVGNNNVYYTIDTISNI